MPERTPLFGAFVQPDHPLYAEYNPKYKSRISELEDQALLFYEAFQSKYEKSAQYLSINYLNLNISVGRYFNDLIRLRSMHDISRLHRTKIAAYMTKWVWLNPIMSSTANFEEFLSLDKESRAALASANFLFIQDLIRYFMPPEIDYMSDAYAAILPKFIYSMKIGVFEEHLAAALLETVSPVIHEDGVDY